MSLSHRLALEFRIPRSQYTGIFPCLDDEGLRDLGARFCEPEGEVPHHGRRAQVHFELLRRLKAVHVLSVFCNTQELIICLNTTLTLAIGPPSIG